MGVENRGTRNGNIWTKSEGRGFKHGFDLKKEFENKRAMLLPDILEISAKNFGKIPSIGTRKILERQITQVNGKPFEKLKLGDYEWMSYAEMHEQVLKIATSLNALNFKPGQRLAIMAETRAEWLLTALGCLKCGLIIVTLYTNLSDSGFIHGINETEVDTVITSYEIIPRLSKILPQCPEVKNIIIFEDQLFGIGNDLHIPDSIRIIPYSKLLSMADDNHQSRQFPNVSIDDTAILMYTSGSTGNPKGVEMTHKNIFFSMIAYTIQADFGKGDRYIAYLPLAHVMELLTEMALIAMGVTIAYSSPFTLTTNSAKISKGTLGDAAMAKPTVMTAVPLVLDRVLKSVFMNVEKQGKFKSKLFKEALRYKQGNQNSLTSKVLDAVIFKKVKAELGGNLKRMVAGGAPLSTQTYSMITAMFGCTIQVGYGCTETTACATSMDVDDTRPGHTGPPNPFLKVKLVNWEEGDYRITDSPRPRGEIHVGGPCVARGYFKLPELTSEEFYEEDGCRWFRTGDIGEFDQTGVLYMIDRMKDLVKLKHGEYISLGNIESKLKTSHWVENICVIADSTEDHTVAIIVPSTDAFKKLPEDCQLNCDQSFEKLCSDEKGIKALLEKLKLYGKQCGLGRWDIPQAIHLTPINWTPDNGLVTAAMKLKRKAVQKEFSVQIKNLYTKSNGY